MNTNQYINCLFASKRENPQKYFRVQICGEKSTVGLPEFGTLTLKKAILGEFQNGHPIFTYRFDSTNFQDYRVSIVMRENKELAYVAGLGTVDHKGYIRCVGKKEEDDEDYDLSEKQQPSDRMFCGVFTTSHFTVFLAIGNMFKKTILRDILCDESEPDLWEVLNLLGQCSETKSEEVMGNVEEE